MNRIWCRILLALSLSGCAAQDANKLYVSAFRQLEKAQTKEPQHRDLEKARVNFSEGRVALDEARYDIATQKFRESLLWSESIVDPGAYEAKMAAKRAEPAPLAAVRAPAPAVAQAPASLPAAEPEFLPAPNPAWNNEPKPRSQEPRALPKAALAKYLAMKRAAQSNGVAKSTRNSVATPKVAPKVAPVAPSAPAPARQPVRPAVPVEKKINEGGSAPVAEVPGARASSSAPVPTPILPAVPTDLSPSVKSAPSDAEVKPVETPSMPGEISSEALQSASADAATPVAAKKEVPNFAILPTPRQIKGPEGMLTPQANTAESEAFETPVDPNAAKGDQTSASATTEAPEKMDLSPDAIALAEAQAATDITQGGSQQTGEEARNLKKSEATKTEVIKAPARPLDKFLPQSAKPKSAAPAATVADAGLGDEAAVATQAIVPKAAAKAPAAKDPTKIPGELSFSPNDASVEPQVMMTLDQTSKFLLENPSSVIQFQGVVGPGESSSIIDTRFESLRAYLVAKGVPEDQVRLASKRRSGNKAEFQMFLIED